jgi:hypothetical protein
VRGVKEHATIIILVLLNIMEERLRHAVVRHAVVRHGVVNRTVNRTVKEKSNDTPAIWEM